MTTLSALKALVAADNCNYEAYTMRYAGLFQDAKQAIAEEESLVAELTEALEGLLRFVKTYDMGGDWEQSNYPALKAARATNPFRHHPLEFPVMAVTR